MRRRRLGGATRRRGAAASEAEAAIKGRRVRFNGNLKEALPHPGRACLQFHSAEVGVRRLDSGHVRGCSHFGVSQDGPCLGGSIDGSFNRILHEERYSRHEGLFGAQGQRRIGEATIGLVGLGGLGMQQVQELAYVGVRNYRAVEFDIVTLNSLNRLVGALPSDVGSPKLDVCCRLIESVQPGATVDLLKERFSLESQTVQSLLRNVDVLFSSVDNEPSRIEVLEFASTYGIPLIDAATDTGTHPNGSGWYGGRVVVAQGDGCPLCLDVIDQDALAVAHMSEAQRREHARIYGVSVEALDATGPSVVSINGVVASLAVTEFLVLTTGLRDPNRLLVYRAERGIVNIPQDPPTPRCPYCAQFRSARQARMSS